MLEETRLAIEGEKATASRMREELAAQKELNQASTLKLEALTKDLDDERALRASATAEVGVLTSQLQDIKSKTLSPSKHDEEALQRQLTAEKAASSGLKQRLDDLHRHLHELQEEKALRLRGDAALQEYSRYQLSMSEELMGILPGFEDLERQLDSILAGDAPIQIPSLEDPPKPPTNYLDTKMLNDHRQVIESLGTRLEAAADSTNNLLKIDQQQQQAASVDKSAVAAQKVSIIQAQVANLKKQFEIEQQKKTPDPQPSKKPATKPAQRAEPHDDDDQFEGDGPIQFLALPGHNFLQAEDVAVAVVSESAEMTALYSKHNIRIDSTVDPLDGKIKPVSEILHGRPTRKTIVERSKNKGRKIQFNESLSTMATFVPQVSEIDDGLDGKPKGMFRTSMDPDEELMKLDPELEAELQQNTRVNAGSMFSFC